MLAVVGCEEMEESQRIVELDIRAHYCVAPAFWMIMVPLVDETKAFQINPCYMLHMGITYLLVSNAIAMLCGSLLPLSKHIPFNSFATTTTRCRRTRSAYPFLRPRLPCPNLIFNEHP